MSSKPQPKPPSNGSKLKSLIPFVAFLLMSTLIEFLVVLYAVDLGLMEPPFPQWLLTFFVVPLLVIVSLAACWQYLAKHVGIRPADLQKARIGAIKRTKAKRSSFAARINSRMEGWKDRVRATNPALKSAAVIFVFFLVFVVVVSLLAYPNLIYQIVSRAYQSNSGLLNFIRGSGQALAPLGNVFSSVNEALLAGSPGFRGFVTALGNGLSTLANADNTGKYLALQNLAVLITAILTLLFGAFGRQVRVYRYMKR